jgi:gluconokinase
LQWDFLEGDAFHSPLSLSKMVRGESLEDDDRFPWLERLGQEVQLREAHGKSSVLACSALKESYRDILRRASKEVRFIHLVGDQARLAERLSRRTGHFADGRLLPSQVAALEPCPGALELDAFLPVNDLVARVMDWLGEEAPPAPASGQSPAG